MDWWVRHPGGGVPVPETFSYTSDRNPDFLSPEQLREMVRDA
jgi:hypothetical protein